MENNISRAQFLRGDFRGRRRPIRPPWALPEALFVDRCTRCGECVAACESGIVQRGQGGFPVVDFSRGECTFCGRCADACHPLALERRPKFSRPWSLVADLGASCLARRGTVCRTCSEQCENGALRFRLVAGGASLPELNLSLCSGCGACVGPCPVNAIVVCEPGEGRQ